MMKQSIKMEGAQEKPWHGGIAHPLYPLATIDCILSNRNEIISKYPKLFHEPATAMLNPFGCPLAVRSFPTHSITTPRSKWPLFAFKPFCAAPFFVCDKQSFSQRCCNHILSLVLLDPFFGAENNFANQ